MEILARQAKSLPHTLVFSDLSE